MRIWERTIATVGLAALVGACAGLENGAQPLLRLQNGAVVAGRGTVSTTQSPRLQTDFTLLLQTITSDCLNVTAAAPTETRRNRLATAYMFGVDLAYNDYERDLLNSIRENDLGAATASLALSSIGSVIGNQDLARALSTTNSIVTGTHTAIDRDYLLNQSLTVLQTQMRANRANQRARVVRRMDLPYAQWDSCMALSDVLAYEQAGTLNGALAAVAASAADSNQRGQAQADDAIMRATVSMDRLSLALRAYADPSAAIAADQLADRRRNVDGIITAGNLYPVASMPVPIRRRLILYADDPARAADRAIIAAALVNMTTIPETERAPIRQALAPAQ